MSKRVFDWSEIRRYLPTKVALSERLPPGIRGELLRPKVALAMPKGAGYVGTYAPIQLKLDPASGLTLDDLDFVVTSGAAGGLVSRSQERTALAARPTVMLLHGYQPGVHVLEVRHHGSGVVLARRKFTVTDQWADDVNGPNLWFSGTVDTPTVAPTWGGGPGTAQNFATVPATGTRRIAVVFVDTSDQRYTTDAPTLAGFQARWQQNAFTGVVGADGVSRSTAAFYGEVSYGNLTVTGTVFSTVVNLPNGWSSYFQIDPRNNMWQAKNEFVNQVVTQANSQSTTANPFNLTGFDMVVCVTQAVTPATGAARVAWPYGGYGVSAATTFGTVAGRGISMPNEWGDGSANDQGGGRTIFQTLAHEMGHTLNLPDLYTPTVAGRNVGGWDPMHAEGPFPHFTLAHRMMLGWIPASWLRLYNFQALGTAVDETITLAPIEAGAPPAGRFGGAEIRVGDGRNYYLEYRIGQAAQIGDRALPTPSRVLLTDVSQPPDPPVIARPTIILVAQHADDQGAVLGAGNLYHEVDRTSPTFPTDFQVDVVSIDGTKADVRIRYQVIGKPDPSIRPWPRDAANQWQSPDIEVSNARSVANPAMFANVPWQGHANTVTATVTNRGTLAAPGVRVDFAVKDYTIGGAPETSIGSDTRSIAPGATATFTTTWTPPAPAAGDPPQHYCVVARVASYQTPTAPPVLEMTDANNLAQSNYARFISASSSPPSREVTWITVGNPFEQPTCVYLDAGQDNPLYRTYLEHRWLVLEPGELRTVRAMFEFAPDGVIRDGKRQPDLERDLIRPVRVRVLGRIADPRDPRPHGTMAMAGIDAVIAHGRGTRVSDFDHVGPDQVGGKVERADGKAVTRGVVLVHFACAKDERAERGADHYVASELGRDGGFAAQAPHGWSAATAYYLPAEGLADSTSTTIAPRAHATPVQQRSKA